jgi:hypothetical protein
MPPMAVALTRCTATGLQAAGRPRTVNAAVWRPFAAQPVRSTGCGLTCAPAHGSARQHRHGSSGSGSARSATAAAAAAAAAGAALPLPALSLESAPVWALLAVSSLAASLAEQRTQWGAAISAPLLAIGAGCALAIAGVLPGPAGCPAYDAVWHWLMPVASALLVIETRDMSRWGLASR